MLKIFEFAVAKIPVTSCRFYLSRDLKLHQLLFHYFFNPFEVAVE